MKLIKVKEPKKLSLVLSALSGVSLGLLISGYLLLMKDVVPRSNSSETSEAKPGNYTHYFSRGGIAPGETPNARTVVSKIQRRVAGPVSVSAEEINEFFGRYKSDKKAEGEAPQSSLEQLNFSVRGDKVIGSFKLVIDPKGDRFEMLVVGDVSFENTEAGPQMSVSNLRINSLPVPGLAGLVSGMINGKVASLALPEELVEMWSNIRRVEVESNKVILDVGLRGT